MLGLALVREGANDDDPARATSGSATPTGSPGTLVSFLEYPAMDGGRRGSAAARPTTSPSPSPRDEELAAWRDYLRSRGVPCTDVFDRGGLRSVYLRDPDGHIVEIARVGRPA